MNKFCSGVGSGCVVNGFAVAGCYGEGLFKEKQLAIASHTGFGSSAQWPSNLRFQFFTFPALHRRALRLDVAKILRLASNYQIFETSPPSLRGEFFWESLIISCRGGVGNTRDTQAGLAPIEGLALLFLAKDGRGTRGTHRLNWRL